MKKEKEKQNKIYISNKSEYVFQCAFTLISTVVCRVNPSVLFLFADYEKDYDSTKRPGVDEDVPSLGTSLNPKALLALLLVPLVYFVARR